MPGSACRSTGSSILTPAPFLCSGWLAPDSSPSRSLRAVRSSPGFLRSLDLPLRRCLKASTSWKRTAPRGNLMATTARRLTFDDLELIPEEHEGERQELIDGELVVTPPPTMNHQSISSNLVYALERTVREQDLGRVYAAPTGIRFTPNNVLIPDIRFIARN